MSSTYIKTLDDLAGEDSIDSRELIDRQTEVEERITELEEVTAETIENPEDLAEEFDELQELREELDQLVSLRDQGIPDYEYGAAFIHEDFFADYARQLADDIGAIDDNHGWPLNCINWEQAADQLKMDYMEVQINGIDYWVRA
jgi:hypothetical protein